MRLETDVLSHIGGSRRTLDGGLLHQVFQEATSLGQTNVLSGFKKKKRMTDISILYTTSYRRLRNKRNKKDKKINQYHVLIQNEVSGIVLSSYLGYMT